MIQKLRNFFRPEEGATAVEYGIMVALIAAVIIGAVVLLGQNVNDAFGTVNSELPAGSSADDGDDDGDDD